MSPRTRPWKRAALVAAVLALGWLCVVAAQTVAAGRLVENGRADVAIVLGAAAYGDRPSPVFEERIRHGIVLYRRGKVAKLLFTGGHGEGAPFAEATVARRYAVARGVPADAILTETVSRTTRQNLVEARRVMRAHDLRTALLVSDPLHLKRAGRMAADLGIPAEAAPTPTSRYRSWWSRGGFLLREVYFWHHYLVTRQ